MNPLLQAPSTLAAKVGVGLLEAGVLPVLEAVPEAVLARVEVDPVPVGVTGGRGAALPPATQYDLPGTSWQFVRSRLGFHAKKLPSEIWNDWATYRHELIISAPTMLKSLLLIRGLKLRYSVQFVSVPEARGLAVVATYVTFGLVEVGVGGRVNVVTAGMLTGTTGTTQ